MPAIRRPFIGLTIAALAGVLVADAGTFPAWVALAVVFLVWTLLRPNTWVLLPAVAASFAAAYQAGSNHAPARELASYLGPSNNKVLEAEGWVRIEGRPDGRARIVRMDWIEIDGGILTGPLDLRVVWPHGTVPPPYGTRLALTGTAYNLEGPRNPGQFDFAAWMARQGIYSELRIAHASEVRIAPEPSGNAVLRWALRTRGHLEQALEQGLSSHPERVGIIKAMTLGVRHDIDPDLRHLFVETGTLHLFAVSGLHVGIVGVIAWFAIRPLRLRRGLTAALVVCVLVAYCLITGMRPSTVRATVMASLVVFALFVNRPPGLANTLAAAAFCILWFRAGDLFEPGFQLSFTVVASLFLFQPMISNLLMPRLLPDPFIPFRLYTKRQKWQRRCALIGVNTFSVSLAAWIGSIPFILLYFHIFTPVAVLANMVVVPAAFVVLSLGAASMIGYAASAMMAAFFNHLNSALVACMLFVLQLFSEIPGGSWNASPALLERTDKIEMVAFDFGSGDAVVLLEPDRRAWVFDAGSQWQGRTVLGSFLRSKGIQRIDGMVLSHGSVHHAGGMPPLMEQFPPRTFAESILTDRSPTRRAVRDRAARKGIAGEEWFRGRDFPLSNRINLEVLFPPLELRADRAQDKALVLRLTIDGWRVLLMSDSGFRTEMWLLENEPDLGADILIKGRHPGDLCGLPMFLAAVNPEVIVASAHPRREGRAIPLGWPEEVQALGMILYRQDQTGAVTLRFSTEEVLVESFLDQRVRTLRRR